MLSAQSYRRDIDGLRALAIIPVVLYHTHLAGFGGGYVGVDIFFVISGFLITGILAREIERGDYSLIRFYERRARRILPALFVMLAGVLAAASWLYVPGDFEGVPRSALAALGFVSNVWFFAHSGYFAAPAEAMPLLHCWSLAVEEQFYIAFPWVLWLCATRAPRWRVPAVALAALVSFGWAWAKQSSADGFAFYMLPPRAWELFAGALLALDAVPPLRSRALREAASLAGLALIGFAVFSYDRHTVFPGVAALPPVLGAGLLLYSAPGTWVGRLLSAGPLVGVGLISYSLYLWHWPLIVFTEYATDAKLAGAMRFAVIGAALAFAWASWRFVERPFRDGKRYDRRQIFRLSAAGIGLLAAVCCAMLPLGGWGQRFSPQVNQLIAGTQDFSPLRAACLNKQIGGPRPQCTIGAKVAPTALLWGDSHGVELSWALGRQMGQHGGALIERTRASCPPVLGYSPASDPDCAAFNADVLDHIIHTPTITRIYMAGFWASLAYRQPDMPQKITATITALRAAGKRVTIIGPVPPQGFTVPRRLAHAAALGQLADVPSTNLVDYTRDTGWFTANYPRWQAQGADILDPLRALADGDHTRLMVDGKPAYFDMHHLSVAGAKAVIAAGGV